MATLNLAVSIPTPRQRRRKKALIGATLFVVFVLKFLWYIGVLGGNVRVVQAGQFYRSAQLTGSHLENVLQRYDIRSVVNLRGSSKNGYYRSEIGVCQELGVEHFDLSMSAYRLPRPEEIQSLLATLDRAPRPVLVHCQQGADRSGMASTIYQVVYEHVPLDQAERDQLTWRYGHFGIFGSWRMDRFFDLYRQTGKGASLRDWMTKSYPGIYADETKGK